MTERTRDELVADAFGMTTPAPSPRPPGPPSREPDPAQHARPAGPDPRPELIQAFFDSPKTW